MVAGALKRRPVDLDFYLHRVFRKTSFRPIQREVITAALEGHDVFLQASTSFGKSLCFQLPAVVSHGVTIVICPLLALMADQVNALQGIGVAVATINSTTPVFERRQITQDLLSGHPRTRLLYVTPELCQTQTFRRTLQTVHAQGQLSRIAIDEAHCISEWGHDFRPAYKELSWFKSVMKNPPVPITAVTATATPRVRADIINMLGLDTPGLKIFNTPSARPNIHYEVRYLEDFASNPMEPEPFQIHDLISWFDSIEARRKARLGPNVTNLAPISGIIYVSFRKAATELANALVHASKGNINAVAYHAGLSPEERTSIQSTWTSPRPFPTREPQESDNPASSFSIIVATTAFGMGIDNPCVRFVVHWSPPKSFESFVQESGRAGRDGRAAASVVYYNTQERDRVHDRIKRTAQDAQTRGIRRAASQANQQAQQESFSKVVRYCETTHGCRHEMIKELFGDFEIEQMHSHVPVPQSNTSNPPPNTSPCDYACDICKEGPGAVASRRSKMVSECMSEDSMDLGMASIMRTMYPGAFSARSGPAAEFGLACHECP